MNKPKFKVEIVKSIAKLEHIFLFTFYRNVIN